MAGEAIQNLDELISLATPGGTGAREMVPFQKRAFNGPTATATANWAVGIMASWWPYSGQPAAPSAFPTTAVACTNATPGALGMTASAAGKRKYLLALQLVQSQGATGGTTIFYDRLGHTGGLSGTSTSAQTTNLPTAALTRRTSGAGVEPWLEAYSSLGGSATTVTASYTNEAGTSGHTTSPVGAGSTSNWTNREAMRPLPLASGDRGCRAVASVTLAASTGTAGNFGVVLVFPIISLPVAVFTVTMQHRSFFSDADGPFDLGIASDACLAMASLPNAATSVELMGAAWFAEK